LRGLADLFRQPDLSFLMEAHDALSAVIHFRPGTPLLLWRQS
jgi:hypothetical protein